MISVREYLNRKGFQWKEQRGQAVMNCPFCPDGDKEKKFAVGLQNGAFNCLHLNSCGVSGSFWDLQKRFGDDPERLYSDNVFISKKKKEYKKPKTKIAPPVDVVVKYLLDRKFTLDTIKEFNIGSHNGKYATIPFYKNGEIVNIKYRNITEKKDMFQESEAEPTLFNRDNITDNYLLICEGEYDAMAFHQYGIPAASVPSGTNNFDWVDTEWEYLDTFPVIYLCYDNDSAGQEAEITCAKKLGLWRCRSVVLPHKDANECLMNGVTRETIKNCIAQAKDYHPAILTSPLEFEKDVVDLFYKTKELNGVETAWDKLTSILKGWRPDELTVWSGRSGAGKSTILNQHVLDIASKGVKSCIASLEMPAKRYLRWAIIQYKENHHPSETAIHDALRWMDDKIYICNTHEETTPETLFEVFEYAARRYNVKHFVIDSLMRVSFPGKDELKEHKAFVSQLLSFAKKYGCHMHLVAHPRKGATDFDEPGKVDVRGSGHITDLAHNVLIVWRVPDEEKEKLRQRKKQWSDMILYLKKNREFGIEGSLKLYYNSHSKKFTETECEKEEIDA
jgi:twinkle protein